MPATDARGRRAAELTCVHCGLPAGAAPPGEPGPFCCAGCATAWSVLHEAGLGDFYRTTERRGVAVAPTGRRYDAFDHPAFLSLHARSTSGGLLEIELYLEGVHCASCVWLVERVPLAVPGAVRSDLEVGRGVVRIEWDPQRTRLSEICRFLDQLGYTARPYRGGRGDAERRREDRAALMQIGVAGAIAGNVMMFAVALYCGWFGHMERDVERYFRWISLALTTPAILGPGRVFFKSAWGALRSRALHMDVPIALALAAGYARGAVNTVRGAGPIYFDGVATLIFLLLVGRFLQQRAQRRAADATALMGSLTPSTARQVEGRDVREVPVEALVPGVVVEVRAGETIPADGVVRAGRSEINRALLSGESRLVAAAPGDDVFAGTLNCKGTLRIRVSRCGEESRIGRILREVEQASRRRAPIVRTADRMAVAFVGLVLLLAAGTWAWWHPRDPEAALDHAIALLVVTCPCALALATPLTFTAAIGRAARAGILIQGGDALETLARPGLMVLDKTGTLTEGRTRLVSWTGPDDVRSWVLALERHSPHPIARGFLDAWRGLPESVADDVTVTAGGGLRGRVAGHDVCVGSPSFVCARAVGVPPVAEDLPPHLTPVWVAVDGRCVGRAGFGDALRPDALPAMRALRARGWNLEILSGDDPAVVDTVARDLGVPPENVRGGASPEDKLAAIAAAERRGPVVMVGDGVNDAAAISRSSVGIGVRGGAEACLAASDVYLARAGVGALVELVDGAHRTLAHVRRGIAFSLVYNAVGATLAAGGIINPLIAALLMPASSLTVVLAATLGPTFDAKPVASSEAPEDGTRRGTIAAAMGEAA